VPLQKKRQGCLQGIMALLFRVGLLFIIVMLDEAWAANPLILIDQTGAIVVIRIHNI